MNNVKEIIRNSVNQQITDNSYIELKTLISRRVIRKSTLALTSQIRRKLFTQINSPIRNILRIEFNG